METTNRSSAVSNHCAFFMSLPSVECPYLCAVNIFYAILAIVVCGYLLLYWLVPKATILYELLRLPFYLYRSVSSRQNNVRVYKYRFGPHRRQYLLLYLPKDKAPSQSQVILYHHGGGWQTGSPELFQINAEFFVKRGYAVVMPSYRRIPFFNYRHIRADLNLGLQKALEALATHGLGDRKIILAGMSAGGNLIGLLYFDRKELSKMGLSQALFAGIAFFGAPLDLSTMKPSPVLYAYAGARSKQPFKQASPIEHCQGDEAIPMLCIQGTHDGMVPLRAAKSFVQNFSAEVLTFHIIPGATHLDVGRWSFEDGAVRKYLVEWLAQKFES